jgi:hypothetical protein
VTFCTRIFFVIFTCGRVEAAASARVLAAAQAAALRAPSRRALVPSSFTLNSMMVLMPCLSGPMTCGAQQRNVMSQAPQTPHALPPAPLTASSAAPRRRTQRARGCNAVRKVRAAAAACVRCQLFANRF